MAVDILKRNNVKVSGRGSRPIVFAHGFGCDQNMWRFVAPAFEEDYRVVLFDYVGWANFLAPVVTKNPERPELARELEESFCSTDPRIARRFAEATFLSDNRRDLRRVRVPSLIMQCSEDAIAPAEVGDYLARHLPHSTLRVLEATGHCPHMSHPEETIRVIKEYLGDDARACA